MKALPPLLVYFGIGALCHAFFVGAHFDWSSAWTWGWLLGWPIMLFVWLWIFALALAALGLVVVGVLALAGNL